MGEKFGTNKKTCKKNKLFLFAYLYSLLETEIPFCIFFYCSDFLRPIFFLHRSIKTEGVLLKMFTSSSITFRVQSSLKCSTSSNHVGQDGRFSVISITIFYWCQNVHFFIFTSLKSGYIFGWMACSQWIGSVFFFLSAP